MKRKLGAISAINLETGDIDWKIAHGETPDFIKNHPALKGMTIPRTGRPGLLGPMVTKTLVICGEAGIATMPGPQTGSPMTYMLDGRQYIVLAVGAGPSSPSQLMAFRLPRA